MPTSLPAGRCTRTGLLITGAYSGRIHALGCDCTPSLPPEPVDPRIGPFAWTPSTEAPLAWAYVGTSPRSTDRLFPPVLIAPVGTPIDSDAFAVVGYVHHVH